MNDLVTGEEVREWARKQNFSDVVSRSNARHMGASLLRQFGERDFSDGASASGGRA